MKKLNNRGSVLQIVLVIFIIMTLSLTLYLTTIHSQATNYQLINQLMKQKNLEIMLTQYFIYEIKDNSLISDDFESEEYEVSYTVDDFGEYLEVITKIDSKEINYSFLVDINVENYQIIKFEYGEV